MAAIQYLRLARAKSVITAVVKFVKNRDGWGFLLGAGPKDSDGKPTDLFFHSSRGMTAEVGKNNYGEPVLLLTEGASRLPQKDDRLVFELGDAKQGKVALWWAFADEFEPEVADLEQIAARAPRLRVQRTTRYTREEKSVTQTLWMGSDVDDLAKKFPRTGDHLDQLVGREHKHFETSVHFELEQPDGSWTESYDPRPEAEPRKTIPFNRPRQRRA